MTMHDRTQLDFFIERVLSVCPPDNGMSSRTGTIRVWRTLFPIALMGLRIVALCFLLDCVVACTPALPTINNGKPTSATPDRVWKTETSVDDLVREKDALEPHSMFAPSKDMTNKALSLPRAIEFALRNNPRTRAAWLRARASAAQLGKDKSSLYPEVNLGVTASAAHQTAMGGRFTTDMGAVGPYINLSYLLFDFGARLSQQDADIAALIESNFAHTAAIQDQIMAVAQAYYQYESAYAFVDSATANVASAQLSHEMAAARHQAGTVDLGDVLQAETALFNARLALKSARGLAETLKGALANELGLRADVAIEVEPLPERVDIGDTLEQVDAVLERAMVQRPDLLAAKAAAAAAWQRAKAAQRRSLPTLTFNANANLSYYIPEQSRAFGDNYSATLTFNYPLFAGFSDSYEAQRAGFEALAKEADVHALGRRIAAQVWYAYQQLRVNVEQLDEVRELLETSKRLEQFYRGRYEAGVGTILDLMTAQSALASARSRYVQARADVLMAMVQLSHDVGELNRHSAGQSRVKTRPKGPRTSPTKTPTSPNGVDASPISVTVTDAGIESNSEVK